MITMTLFSGKCFYNTPILIKQISCNFFYSSGFPHRMRFKAFLSRYSVIARASDLRRVEDKCVEDCHTILARLEGKPRPPGLVVTWAIGKRHIFLR